MLYYSVKRLAALIPLLFGISVLIFAMISFCPGDPARITLSAMMGIESPPEAAVAEMRLEMGLDQPLYIQYGRWLKRVFAGDFGYSYQTGRSVVEEIFIALPATVWLASVTLGFTILIVVPIGVLSAARKGSWLDKSALMGSLVSVSMPDFFIAVVLILIFSVFLKLVPVAGYGQWKNVLLPAVSLAVANAAITTRLMRTSMIAALEEKYVITARAKGLGEWAIVAKHALRNAAVPVMTYLGTQFGYLFGGTVVIESLFLWPGLGRLLVEAVRERDIFVVQGCVLTIALAYVLVNLAVDLLYAFIDPRIRYEKSITH